MTDIEEGRIIVPKGTEVWLSFDHGYPQTFKSGPDHHFTCVEQITGNLGQWQGMPWFHRFDPKTLRIWKITTETIEEVEEVNTP
jgi:hypothetical protein